MNPPELRIGGQWLSMICHWTDLNYSFRRPGGDWEATWKVHVPTGWRHWTLDDSVTDVEVMIGGRRAWLGDMFEVDWETGQCVAFGRHRQAANFLALDGDAVAEVVEPTGDLDLAYDIATGAVADSEVPDSHKLMQGVRGFTVGTVMHDVVNPVSIQALIDVAANSGHGTPLMGPDGIQRFVSDTPGGRPKWHVHPDVVELGYADDEYASSIIVHWISDGTDPGYTAGAHYLNFYTDEVMHARKPVEYPVDVTSLGQINLAAASEIGGTILAKALIPGWTNDIPVTALTVVDNGGKPVDPWVFRDAGVRAHGARHPKWPHPYVDVLAGEVNVNVAARTASLKPLGKKRRSIAEIVEDVIKAGPTAA